jgi:hypothetical protein
MEIYDAAEPKSSVKVSIPIFSQFSPDFSPNIPDFSPSCDRARSTVLDCSVVCTHLRLLKNYDYQRLEMKIHSKRPRKSTGKNGEIIPDFPPNVLKSTGYFSKRVWLGVILRMSYRISPQIYHICIERERIHLDDADLLPDVPAAYVGRPTRPDDLEGPLCDEEACRKVGTVSGSEQPDFSPIMERACADESAVLQVPSRGGCIMMR